MSTINFIHDLVSLLVRFDRGMSEFEDPPPSDVAKGLMYAVMAFGDAGIPVLHEALIEAEKIGILPTHLIDVLGELHHPSSVPYLIDFHQHYRDYMSGLAAIQALKKLKIEEAYIYLRDILLDYAKGDKRVIDSRHELVVACEAMGEWHDERAIEPLQLMLNIEPEYPDLHHAATEALLNYA